MPRETLLDFFDDRIRSDETFLVYDGRYRSHTYTYAQIRTASLHFAFRLHNAGILPQDKVILWGENRAEWIVAFWGCLLIQAVAVPIDFRASPDLLTRVQNIVTARIIVAGRELPAPELRHATIWDLEDLLDGIAHPETNELNIDRDFSGENLAEIIFTSGATAEPKGVQITHANVLSNIVPVEEEIRKYVKYGRPVFPLRFLNLLPLSHMFGQAMGTFIPPMLNGITVFMRGYNPDKIVRQIKTRRISVLVCVPKILDVLRNYVETLTPEVSHPVTRQEHVAKRWWRYRRVHRLFGLKFWAFVVGGAPLDPELETFWSRLGFLVIQGYGLTETAPIVSLNHPFRPHRGSVGTPIRGVDIKIADDGEILVRGGNVTRGYYNAPEATAAAFRDGWFHTGDIGTINESGQLNIRGRKKEMIVTPEGLNVFPEDVEHVIHRHDGVIDAAVVGADIGGQERIHAVLILETGADAETIIGNVNDRLEDHQRIRGYSIWTDTSLPRTEGTQKLKRHELKQWVAGRAFQSGHQVGSTAVSIDEVLAQFARDRTVTDETTLSELGLSSIERIELMLELERVCDRSIDETVVEATSTIGDLKSHLQDDALLPSQSPIGSTETVVKPISFPTWSQARIPKLFRRVTLGTFLLPLTRLFAWISIDGATRIDNTTGPILYAANHQSHMDLPVILAALPSQHRYRVVTAAALEWFAAHFYPSRYSRRERFTKSLAYYLGVLCFNVVPLPQKEAGTREALRQLGTLLGHGSSVLIFPEGRRRTTGHIDAFQPGVGMLAAQLQVPVVPVRIDGVDRILGEGWHMARPGRVRVSFGFPMRFNGDNYQHIARQIEDAVKAL